MVMKGEGRKEDEHSKTFYRVAGLQREHPLLSVIFRFFPAEKAVFRGVWGEEERRKKENPRRRILKVPICVFMFSFSKNYFCKEDDL